MLKDNYVLFGPSLFVFMWQLDVYVVLQFFPWLNFNFLLFLWVVMYDNEFKTKEKKN